MSNPHERDPQTEALLRQALHEEANMITPDGDGLANIRERTARPAWWKPALAVLGVAVVAGAGVGIGLSTRGTDDGVTTVLPAASGTTSTTPSSPSPLPSDPSASSAQPGQTQEVVVPLYWTGGADLEAPDPIYPRLYREFRRVPLEPSGSAVTTAVREMLAGEPTDPDYDTAWPTGLSVDSVTVAGSLATVALKGQVEAPRDPALSRQQLVYTVTAADKAITSVAITLGGKPLAEVWGKMPPGPTQRGDQIEALAFVWLTSPEQGATVSSPVTLEGQATVFEATVNWQVVDAAGKQVAEGFATASEGAPGRGTWTAEVDLAPGRYTVRAFESSAKDGSELGPDTKEITVR